MPLSQQSLLVLSSLAYHDYEGLAVNDDEKPRLVRDLGDRKNMILRNHGLLTVGESVADAFISLYLLEASSMIQVRAQAGGGALIPISEAVLDGIQQQVAVATRGSGPSIAWPGLLRRLERQNPGYAS